MHSVELIAKDKSGHWLAEHKTPDKIRNLVEIRWMPPQAPIKSAPLIPEQDLLNEHLAIVDAITAIKTGQ